MAVRRVLIANYLLAMLSGVMWYGQFFFYGMGTTQLGAYHFASWSLHMAFIIVFSNLWGLCLGEWKGVNRQTQAALWLGIITLIIVAAIIATFGSILQRGYGRG